MCLVPNLMMLNIQEYVSLNRLPNLAVLRLLPLLFSNGCICRRTGCYILTTMATGLDNYISLICMSLVPLLKRIVQYLWSELFCSKGGLCRFTMQFIIYFICINFRLSGLALIQISAGRVTKEIGTITKLSKLKATDIVLLAVKIK